jgi:hypothetical protein
LDCSTLQITKEKNKSPKKVAETRKKMSECSLNRPSEAQPMFYSDCCASQEQTLRSAAFFYSDCCASQEQSTRSAAFF